MGSSFNHYQPPEPIRDHSADAPVSEDLDHLRSLTPAGQLAYIPESLHGDYMALPDEERAGLDLSVLRPEIHYRDRPPADHVELAVNMAGKALEATLAEHQGYVRLTYDTPQTSDELHQRLDHLDHVVEGKAARIVHDTAAKLEAFELGATRAIEEHRAATWANPDAEAHVERRFANAFKRGDGAVVDLLDAMRPDKAAPILARIARQELEAIALDADEDNLTTYARRDRLLPIIDAFEAEVSPALVEARSTLAAVAQHKRRLLAMSLFFPRRAEETER